MAGQSGKRASPCCLGPPQDRPFVGFEQTDDFGDSSFVSSGETPPQQLDASGNKWVDDFGDDSEFGLRRPDSPYQPGVHLFPDFDEVD
ncbi:hypothetical protein LB507_007282 [Fusarium sp. FIESC RH6]|nr:hypothetical protein LB507_007282 [Fusarium sp. FIESC RH6]